MKCAPHQPGTLRIRGIWAMGRGMRRPEVALFWNVVELDQLREDGVSVDTLLPKFPLEREMAGGLKIDYLKPVRPGDWLTATRTLSDIYEKQGRSGPMIFYEVTMDIVDDSAELVIREKTTRILK